MIKRGTLKAKEQEDAPEKPFDPAPFPQFLFRPGRRQAGTLLLPFGIPGDYSGSVEDGMNPEDEPQSPIRGV